MGTPAPSYWQVTLPFEGQGEDKKKKKISVSQKPKPLTETTSCHWGPPTYWQFHHAWVYLVFFHLWREKKNDVSRYVIFNATLLDFTVK